MEKSAGIPSDVPNEGHPQSCHSGPPPPYMENPHPQGGSIPPGQGYPQYDQGLTANPQGYPPAGQGYPLAGQGYPPAGHGYPTAGQGYPTAGQGYPTAGQGYPPPGQAYPQGYGYPQQQFHHGNVVLAQPLIQSQPITGPLPRDHMCSAIFVTLCCFWPTGIVAIMRASDARSALARGDVAAAHSYANSAKSMVTISIIVGIIAFIVVGIIIGVYVGIVVNSLRDYD
ncbi:unnamed protein product [Candidula unifasciata]|uniref:Proline-rich transmembrane protein 1 n=1 Tax=Candidula unifasciata TaxID=100452 RepID=A0A8S3YMV7_9EUPU|nr:unnamed protein product [Candidula unifasciata]